MTLVVSLKCVKVLKSDCEKFLRIDFRGETRESCPIHQNEELVQINQRFEWQVNHPLEVGEIITLQLHSHGRWGPPVLKGTYRLSLQVVMEVGQLTITDTLLDDTNRIVPLFVDIEIEYIHNHILKNLEENIKNMEKSLRNKETVIDMESGDESKSKTLKIAGKKLLKRGSSASVEKTVRLAEGERKRHSTFKAVRSFMRFGRSKRRLNCDDEERGLLDAPGTSSDQERPSSETSASSDDVLIDIESPMTTPKMNRRLQVMDSSQNLALKAADFQLCITIIEARQLAGLNMDPVVCVQVGDLKKYTSVKESTNCPYYNEYFVFDFHMAPVMLFDKIITISVYHSRNILRTNKLLGNFRMDIATVWSQPDRQFYHKWALLTDPDDMIAGAKGYLKCDICIIGKGDPIKIPPKSDRDEDDIEGNLLLPHGVPMERQRARFIIAIYKAEGLPKMNYSILANMKKAFTGENQDMVDPYVEISFAGMTGYTTVKKNCSSPVWDEQIVFTEMFPPLCQRMKIQLKDDNPVRPSIIGTHFLDLKTISHDGERGFMPIFGPTYINMYGSTRDYSLLDQHAHLNKGLGEGISYRARVLVAMRTEIMEIVDNPTSEVELEPSMPVNEKAFEKHEEFFLFSTVFDANMIDKRLVDKAIQFEISIGNSGNNLDGNRESVRRSDDLAVADLNELSADTGYWQSVTMPSRAASSDKTYYYLPYNDTKHCVHIRSIWPDHRRRMYNSNMISKIVENFEEGLSEVKNAQDADTTGNMQIVKLKAILEQTSEACANYARYMSTAPPLGKTRFDRERHRLCISEMEQLSSLTRHLKALITKHSLKERLKTAHAHLKRLKHLCEDPSHTMPDVLIWMISNGKRLAYYRIPARDVIYSANPQENGKFCGKLQTLFLKWPGKRGTTSNCWSIPAKISIYLWLGNIIDKPHFLDGLPPGYEVSVGVKNAPIPRADPPPSIFYAEKHRFQMRAYIYQARSLIGSDSSGLSDPYARIIIGENTATTQVIDETVSPTWDELLLFEDVLLYSTMEHIKSDPPTIIIEIFDQDKVGKAEFIGRTMAKPHVRSFEDICESNQRQPMLEWYEISRGDNKAGELLATFELLELPGKQDTSILPELPSPRDGNGKSPVDVNKGPILPVPRGIRPTLSKYRIEVLFWGLRDLKRVHLLPVNKPRVDIECAGNIISSTVIQSARRNPNFSNPIKFVDVELPDQDLYRPPLTIRVVDCRSFGRTTLVGTHTINSIQKYIYTPMTRKEQEIEERKKSLIQLQNLDLRPNCVATEDMVTVETEKETFPLLTTEPQPSTSYGTGAIPKDDAARKRIMKREAARRRRANSKPTPADEQPAKDWWEKYFASADAMIEEEKESKRDRQGLQQGSQLERVHQPTRENPNIAKSERDRARTRGPSSPTPNPTVHKPKISKYTLSKIYPHELEAVPEYDEFKDWLHSFELYRGKKSSDDTEDDKRVVGVFKGAIKVYKLPLPKDIRDYTVMGFDPKLGFFQGVPSNEPKHVLVRVYLVKALDLHPMDINGKADPYVVLTLGSTRISDKENYISKQLNPVFGKCIEIDATFPQDSVLTIQVYDWDLLGSDELIGETKIDLENRFYSRHRGLCGLPLKYDEDGYNAWRDAMKPTFILAKLCKEGKYDPPIYEHGRVRIGRTTFNIPMENTELFTNPNTYEEQMALLVLRRWHELPRVGTVLVSEHIETRPLYNPNRQGIEQGRLELWVDLFPKDVPSLGASIDISPRRPKSFELRVIIWNTDDVVLEDDAFFTGEKMSDIYVKGWLRGPDDCQSTDIHYRSLTGEGNFNWRFIYPFEYLEAEERIVITRRETVFSWDESECKIPPRLELQVWDADHFTSDDFLGKEIGAVTLDLNRFPRGAKSANLCTLEMLRNDGSVPMVNIFKQKRVRGWWPFYIKRDNEEMVLTGKVEAEIHLLTGEEADKAPAGQGRSEPDPLDKPNRPDASFMWFLNPLKSLRYIMWHNYKWTIMRSSFATIWIIIFFLIIFAFPGYLVKKFLGA